jgi:uncharacterized OsmC-like protein
MSSVSVRDAIERVSAVISAQPGKGRTKGVPASARLLDGLRCEVHGPNAEIVTTDMPPAMGGSASGPNPGWLLRAALASCNATAIAMRAAKLGISLTQLEVTVESESDNRGLLGLDDEVSAGLSGIRMRVKIAAKGSAAAELREVVEWADAHSPVGCTVRGSAPYALELDIASEA